MNPSYEGQAIMPDGSTVSKTGTLQECAAWADELMKEASGGIRISITIQDDK